MGGPVAPYIQSERRDTYGKYARLLVERGHAYYCFCEKTESEEESGQFDRAADPCRDLDPAQAQARVDAGEPYVIRQSIPHGGTTTFHDAIFGDITVENKHPGRPGPHQAGRPAHLQLRQRGGRPPHGHHPRGPGQRVPLLRPQVRPALPGLRLGGAHLRPLLPRHAGSAHNKMTKRHGDPSYEDLPRPGLPHPGHPELRGPPGLEPPGGTRRSGRSSPWRSCSDALRASPASPSPPPSSTSTSSPTSTPSTSGP